MIKVLLFLGLLGLGAAAHASNIGQVVRVNVTTDSSGNWNVTFATPFNTATPIVKATAIAAALGTQPITCMTVSTSQTGASGWCKQAATATVSVLGAVVNIFQNAPSTGTRVMVVAADPTQ